jgi:hypothetical protein
MYDTLAPRRFTRAGGRGNGQVTDGNTRKRLSFLLVREDHEFESIVATRQRADVEGKKLGVSDGRGPRRDGLLGAVRRDEGESILLKV